MEIPKNYLVFLIRFKLLLISIFILMNNTVYSSGSYVGSHVGSYSHYYPKQVTFPVFFKLSVPEYKSPIIGLQLNLINFTDAELYFLYEWKNYFFKKYKRDFTYNELIKITYEIDGITYQDFKSSSKVYKKGSLKDFIKNVLDKDVAEYLFFIKEANQLYGAKDRIKKTEEYFDIAYSKVKDKDIIKFLRDRYAYFAYRLRMSLAQPEKPEIYDELEESVDKDSIFYYKILGYKAMRYNEKSMTDYALKLYAKIYEECSLLRTMAYTSIQNTITDRNERRKYIDALNIKKNGIFDDYKENIMNVERLIYFAENNKIKSSINWFFSSEDWNTAIRRTNNGRIKLNLLKLRHTKNKISYSQKDWDRVIEETSDKELKCFLWYTRYKMQKRDYSIEFIKGIVEADPKSPLTEVMLKSMIETIEKNNLFKGGDFKNILDQKRETKLYSDLADFCGETGSSSPVNRPDFWFAAGSYLSILDGDVIKAEKLYKKADKNSRSKDQIEIVRILIELVKNREENALSKNIQQIILRSNSLKNEPQVWVLLGQKFILFGDYLTASKFYLKAGYKRESDFLMTIMFDEENFRNRNAKYSHEFKSMLTGYGESELEYLLGVKYLRREKYDKALKIFKGLPSDIINSKRIRFVEDSIDIDPKIPWIEKNILEFTERVMSLLEKDDVPMSFYKLANIYHYVSPLDSYNSNIFYTDYKYPFKDKIRNMRRLSNNHYANYTRYRDYTVTETHKYFGDIRPDSWPLYLDNELYEAKREEFLRDNNSFEKAAKYYRECIDIADKELTAKCLVLLNSATKGPIHTRLGEKNKKKMDLIYYLNSKYKDTDFYKDFIRKCPLIEKFQ